MCPCVDDQGVHASQPLGKVREEGRGPKPYIPSQTTPTTPE